MALAPTTTTGSGNPLVAQAQGALSNAMRMTRQPAIQRAMPAILILILMGVGFLAWMMLSEPAKTPIYPGMAEADKSAVVETLTGAGITASIDPTSGEVLVASNDYYRARMTLASAGLPQSVPAGSDMLTDLPMGASRSVEGARLRQAQEYDLARSITEIAAVSSARVHLAIPERSAFLRDTTPPRASVFLQLAQGRALDRGQVDAIVNLVSSSIPGMAREDVTVVDQMGRLLSRGSDDSALMLSDRELEHRVQIENLYKSRIETILAPITGPENISVQVTVDMDFTRTEMTEEKLDPQGSVVLSEQSQSSESSSGQARGIPGAISNTPPPTPALAALDAAAANAATDPNAATGTPTADAAAAAAASTGPTNRSESSTRNYEVSRTVTATQAPGARVMKISAAVLVRTPPVVEGEEPTGPSVEDLTKLAQTAIGYDEKRGDSVAIIAQAFEPVAIAGGVSSSVRGMTWLPDVMRQVAIVVVLAIIGLGVVRPILDRVLVPVNGQVTRDANGNPTVGTAAVEVNEGESLSDVQKRLNTRRIEIAENALSPSATRDERFNALRQMASDDPARIANVLHRMMSEEIDQVS